MSITSWICAQLWSKAEFLRKGLRLLATSEKELPQPSRMWNWLFWHLCWRFSEKVGFEETGMGLSWSSRRFQPNSTQSKLRPGVMICAVSLAPRWQRWRWKNSQVHINLGHRESYCQYKRVALQVLFKSQRRVAYLHKNSQILGNKTTIHLA